MIVARQKFFDKKAKIKSINHASKSFLKNLNKTGFSNKNLFRKNPILASMHRGLDGAIVGVVFCAALMSALALHSQYLWRLSFSRLQMTRDLNHRLEEATANLERYYLATTTLAKPMVATKATDLLYIKSPRDERDAVIVLPRVLAHLRTLVRLPVRQGY